MLRGEEGMRDPPERFSCSLRHLQGELYSNGGGALTGPAKHPRILLKLLLVRNECGQSRQELSAGGPLWWLPNTHTSPEDCNGEGDKGEEVGFSSGEESRTFK